MPGGGAGRGVGGSGVEADDRLEVAAHGTTADAGGPDRRRGPALSWLRSPRGHFMPTAYRYEKWTIFQTVSSSA